MNGKAQIAHQRTVMDEIYDGMASCLKTIADMQFDEKTDYKQMAELIRAVARIELTRAAKMSSAALNSYRIGGDQ